MGRGPRSLLGLCGALAFFASCSSPSRSVDDSKTNIASSREPSKAEVRVVRPPADFGIVQQRDRAVAFRRTGNVLATESATFAAAVSNRGGLLVTPRGTRER